MPSQLIDTLLKLENHVESGASLKFFEHARSHSVNYSKKAVKLRSNLTVVLTVVALALVIYQMVQRHLSPWYLIVLLLLFAGRYFARQPVRKREQILKEVPRHPLGLSEDE